MDFRQYKNLLRSRHFQLEESVFAKLSLYLIHPAIASAADATSTSQVWVVAGNEFNPYAVDRILHYRVLVLPMFWNGQRMMKVDKLRMGKAMPKVGPEGAVYEP